MIDLEKSTLPGAGTPTRDKTDSINNGSFMVQVRADFADHIVADYTFDYTKADQTPPFSQLLSITGGSIFANPKRVTTASIDAPVYEKSRSYGHALTLSLDMGAATLKSITAYRNMDWADGLDLDATPYAGIFTQRITDYDAWSQELQLTGQAFDERLSYVLGAFYFDENAYTKNPQQFGADFYDSRYGAKTKAFALYAQGDYKLTEALKLTLGARYTHEKKDISRYLSANNGTPLVINFADVNDAKYDDFSPSATLSYEVAPEINTYVRFAKGFKSGGFNGETNVFTAPTQACPIGAPELCDPYKPEKVDSFEVGIKTRLLDNRVVFNVAAFRDEHKDIQLSIFTAEGAAASIVRNAAKARIQGLEFEAVLRPIDTITINGSLAVLDAKYKSYFDGGKDVAGNRAFPHTPKVTAAAGIDWKVIEGDWGKLNLYGDVNYVSSYYTYPYAFTLGQGEVAPVAGTSKSKGRTIVNLRATVADIQLGGGKSFDLSGFVRNLTKEADPSNFIDFGPANGGLVLGYFPEPRTFGVTAGIKF